MVEPLLINCVDEGAPDYIEVVATEASFNPHNYTIYGKEDSGGTFTWNLADSSIGDMSEGQVYGEEEGTNFSCPFNDGSHWSVRIEDSNGNVLDAVHKRSKVLAEENPIIDHTYSDDVAIYRDVDADTNSSSDWAVELSPHSYKNSLNPNQTGTFPDGPSAPSNVHFNDTATEDQLTLDWDTTGTNATGYYVYRAQSSGTSKSDYTQVANVTGPPYTDTTLEDGERYYYRVSSYN